jgi:hypothetical protein
LLYGEVSDLKPALGVRTDPLCTLSLREGAYAGRVVKVADAPNETLALVIKGFLDEAGIPVLIQKGGGFNIQDFLSAGPRDVLVTHLYAAEAGKLLEDTTGLDHGRE